MELKLNIVGTTPLLQNNASVMLAGGPAKTRAEKDLPPHDQAPNRVYLNSEEQFVHPTVAFRNAIMGGGKEVKIGRANAAKYLSGALLLNPQPSAVLLNQKTKKPFEKFDVHVAMVVMPSTGGRVIRGWPKFENWMVELDAYLDEVMWSESMETLQRIFDFSGRLYGVGDGRPEKRKLGFGQFKVEIV